MYKLEIAAGRLANRLVEGIIESTNIPAEAIESLISDVTEETEAFVAAIRETIIAEIEARK